MKKANLQTCLVFLFLMIALPVLAVRADDPPTVPITVDYSGNQAQPGSSVTTLALSGNVNFVINKTPSANEFDDFVSKTTIIVKHAGVDGAAKTLQVFLTDAGTLAAVKAASLLSKSIDVKLDVSKTGAVADDKLIISCKVTAGNLTTPVTLTITKDAEKPVDPKPPVNLTFDASLKTYLAGAGGSVDIDGTQLSAIMDNTSRYDKVGNKAYIVVDQNGELIDNCPVNIDQDDYVYVIIVGRKDKIQAYSADFVGTYNPVDLQMRSFTTIDPGFKPNGVTPYKAEDYTVVFKKRGPFTSANVVVKVKDNVNSGAILATYTLAVNTLFHLGFGVGFNRTSLENPDYIVTPLNSTQNTITKTNGGKRNLVSVNVIWYWSSTLKYLTRGDNITRGRDVLKEPDFIERINPTFGVALSGNITDNMFAGLTLEFARGGSLFGGYHFGVVKRLAYPASDFIPGTTVFTGAATDIKTSNISDKAWAFGLILDTRILNALFKKGS